jgi:hypothetical protein
MRKNNTVSCLLFHKMAAPPERHFSGRSLIHFLTQTYQLCYKTENNFVEQRPSPTANGLLVNTSGVLYAAGDMLAFSHDLIIVPRPEADDTSHSPIS